MNANEARELMRQNCFKMDAIQYAIERIEQDITEHALKGNRCCLVTFNKHPYGYAKFVEKYGKDNVDNYKTYDVEQEVKEHFTKEGFEFKLIRDDICGGVRQDPYWVICW